MRSATAATWRKAPSTHARGSPRTSRWRRGDFPTANVGCFPDINAIAISGGYAFAANGGTDDIAVVDVERALRGDTEAEVARIAVERGPWGLTIRATGDLLAVGNRESAETGAEGNTISILDVERMIAARADAELARVRVGTDALEAPARPFGLTFTPDGRRIVVANFRTDNVSIVDVAAAVGGDQNAEVARIALFGPAAAAAQPRGVAITPDGRYAAVSGGARDAASGGLLWLIDLSSSEVVATVTGVGNEPYLLDIAPATGVPR